jgi:hypothetical protein
MPQVTIFAKNCVFCPQPHIPQTAITEYVSWGLVNLLTAVNHLYKGMHVEDRSSLFNSAYQKNAGIAKAVSGFVRTGIYLSILIYSSSGSYSSKSPHYSDCNYGSGSSWPQQ